MQLVNEKAERYVEHYSSEQDALLQQIIDETNARHKHAHMLSGSTQGRLLEFISRMLKPSKILEIGTFTGFSALCLAKGLDEAGELHTIELRPEDAATAQGYFDRSPRKEQVFLHIGDAKTIIPSLHQNWDLVFIDADKTSYIEYYELTLQRLSPAGWIIVDNVLFHGEVLEQNISGKNALAIQAFNEHVKNDPRVDQVLLTVRDGLTIIKKK
jgi:caffeoyl-CoA O-methyltransferase